MKIQTPAPTPVLLWFEAVDQGVQVLRLNANHAPTGAIDDPSEEVIELETDRVLYGQRDAALLAEGVIGRPPRIHVSHESADQKFLRPAGKCR